MITLPEIWDAKQAADYLRCSTESVRRMFRDGEIPNAFRLSAGGKGCWRIYRDDVLSWVRERKSTSLPRIDNK